MSKQWSSVEVECWNYIYHAKSDRTIVSINKDRLCDSDCENTFCPLHKSHGGKQA